MSVIPYSLVSKSTNPLQFYDELSLFTDRVSKKGNQVFSETIDDFKHFSEQNKLTTYSHDECLMEILMLGVFTRNYSRYVSSRVRFYKPVFNRLYSLRKKYPALKRRIDELRGWLGTTFLLKDGGKTNDSVNNELLICWLECTHEFKQETERLNLWIEWLQQKSEDFQKSFLENVNLFAERFSTEAARKLGKYTSDWNKFIAENASVYPKREDHIFCTRQPNEYYLNMVASEVMNRSLRSGFVQTREKILLLPTCMSKKVNCAATVENEQLVCRNCSVDCNVSKLKCRMELQQVKTVLIPHSSGFSKYLEPWKNSETTALIGVACVLNLLTGGYEMQKLNIPSQCIFLDSCGCEKHWLSGKPTNINEKQLDRLLAC